ncbi:DUF4057 domain-containing protein [Heracleum sosnowskyi]|uniref:DUF4057 domain-containing protein n=1 Tax=Heracleum sosnowskyi TaxID=360622 RepID=A0AAD8HPF7_9APIA|nr:DUF4057 domain-containing protein [Heracleum sosnowskyi]
MERAVQKPHQSTADLLTWSEIPPPATNTPRSAARSHQPSEGITKVLSGVQVTNEETESLNRSTCRKPCSGHKLKEVTGNKIFAEDGENGELESGSMNSNSNNKTSVRIVQQAAHGISQISFSTEGDVSPKKPTTLPEVAKQRELSGTLGELDSKIKKQSSDAKCKELSGHDIFGPPPEIPARKLTAARNLEVKANKDMEEPAPPRNLRTSVKVSNPAGGHSNILFGDEPETKTTKKIHNQKFAELTGNDIFKGDVPPGSAEKSLSVAKLREMSGSDIFSDGKAEPREGLGGVRQAPGGDSSIALV